MHIAFICPRYGVDAAGGAEILTQQIAEHVNREGDLTVDILTTCAKDHFGWTNYYKPGAEEINGIRVHRFTVNEDRDVDTFFAIQSKITAGVNVSQEEQITWLRESVNSRTMYDYIEKQQDNYDCFIFIPYLFGTTFWGTKICPDKSLIIPTLHDEVYARQTVFRDMFEQVAGIMFNSEPEMELAQNLFNLNDNKLTMVGLGFEEIKGTNPEDFKSRYCFDSDYILYLGRREKGKNTPLLLRYFQMYKKRNPGPLKLLFLGSGEIGIPDDSTGSYIIDLGFLPKEKKYDAHAAASFLCQPSVNESLSIVVMESWLCSVPVLVHNDCAVTKDHCVKSNGGLFFSDYLEFEETVNFMLANPSARRNLGENGKKYVRNVYNWEAVQERFRGALKNFGF